MYLHLSLPLSNLRLCAVQDTVPGGGVCSERGGLRAERAVPPGTDVDCSAGCRLCVWVPLEPDASAGRGAVWHVQLRHALLLAAVCHNSRDLLARHKAGAWMWAELCMPATGASQSPVSLIFDDIIYLTT